MCDSWRLKLVCAVQNSEQPFKQYNSKGSESTGCTKSAGFGCVVGGFLGCGGFWFGFVLFLGVSCLSVVFLVGLFLWFFFVKAHPRTPFSITVHFYNTNITIFHIVSKTNIKAEKTLWREILICPDNCIITLSTAFDINFSLGDKKKIYVNLYIHSECPNSKLFRTIWSLAQN